MSTSVKLATPQGYQALSPQTVCFYLGGIKPVAERLGGDPASWSAREVGDGNLNLVFIVEGNEGAVVVKQALPYVRMVGESWPLPLARAHYEHLALVEQNKLAAGLVPEIYHHDAPMALTVMEYLGAHIIARKGLIKGITYPKLADDIGRFAAHTLFYTSDLALDPVTKREKTAQFLTNTAMCKITEDLLFDEPYFDAELNRHTSPQLDDLALDLRKDSALKLAVQGLKHKFMNEPQALLHGDLHTGSIMVNEGDTRVIDPEFAFFGPAGFDLGAFIANLFLAYFSQGGHEETKGVRDEYAAWILQQIQIFWDVFESEFNTLWAAREGGELYNPRLYVDTPELEDAARKAYLRGLFEDALGYAGVKMIRRIVGLAHVEDMESIENPDVRAACERRAVAFARRLIVERAKFADIAAVIKQVNAA